MSDILTGSLAVNASSSSNLSISLGSGRDALILNLWNETSGLTTEKLKVYTCGNGKVMGNESIILNMTGVGKIQLSAPSFATGTITIPIDMNALTGSGSIYYSVILLD